MGTGQANSIHREISKTSPETSDFHSERQHSYPYSEHAKDKNPPSHPTQLGLRPNVLLNTQQRTDLNDLIAKRPLSP